MTHDSRQRTIDPYSTTINTLSILHTIMILLLKINSIKEHHDDPFHRIDYMSAYALNSPFFITTMVFRYTQAFLMEEF